MREAKEPNFTCGVILANARRYKDAIFTPDDVAEWLLDLGILPSESAVRPALTRLSQLGYIDNIERGKYVMQSRDLDGIIDHLGDLNGLL